MPLGRGFQTQTRGNGPSAHDKLRKQDDPKVTFYWTSLGYITVRLQADDILLDPMLKDGIWTKFTQEWNLSLCK